MTRVQHDFSNSSLHEAVFIFDVQLPNLFEEASGHNMQTLLGLKHTRNVLKITAKKIFVKSALIFDSVLLLVEHLKHTKNTYRISISWFLMRNIACEFG